MQSFPGLTGAAEVDTAVVGAAVVGGAVVGAAVVGAAVVGAAVVGAAVVGAAVVGVPQGNLRALQRSVPSVELQMPRLQVAGNPFTK